VLLDSAPQGRFYGTARRRCQAYQTPCLSADTHGARLRAAVRLTLKQPTTKRVHTIRGPPGGPSRRAIVAVKYQELRPVMHENKASGIQMVKVYCIDDSRAKQRLNRCCSRSELFFRRIRVARHAHARRVFDDRRCNDGFSIVTTLRRFSGNRAVF